MIDCNSALIWAIKGYKTEGRACQKLTTNIPHIFITSLLPLLIWFDPDMVTWYQSGFQSHRSCVAHVAGPSMKFVGPVRDGECWEAPHPTSLES